jgi:membrane fusion protein (multidrug efflux system)
MKGNGTVVDQLQFQPVDLPRGNGTPSKPSRRSFKRPLSIFALCGLFLGGSFLGSSWIFYRLGHVVSRQATVQARVSHVGARFDGVVAEVLVEENQHVQADQVLARLDDRHLVAALERARSELQRAEKKLETEKLAISHEQARLENRVNEALAEMAASASRLEAAETEFEHARSELQRISGLHTSGSGSDKELRDARTLMQVSAARKAAARSDRQAADAVRATTEAERAALAVRQAGLAVYEFEVIGARAAVAVAQANLDAAVIRAPHDGWVVRRIVEPGGSVRVGQPILSVWTDEKLWIDAWIEQDSLAQVHVGSHVSVSIEPYGDRIWSGVVESVNLTALNTEPTQPAQLPGQTHLACVRIAVADPDARLFPGLSAVVGIPRTESKLLGWAARLHP